MQESIAKATNEFIKSQIPSMVNAILGNPVI